MSEHFLANRILTGKYLDKLKDQIHAKIRPEEFPGPNQTDPQQFYLEFKNRIVPLVEAETEKLKEEILRSDNCHLLLLKRTALVDAVVDAAFQAALWYGNRQLGTHIRENEIPLAIVARGGYGRGETYLLSDIDLQVVTKSGAPETASELAQDVSKHFEYLLIYQDIFPVTMRYAHSEIGQLESQDAPSNLRDFFALLEHRYAAGNPLVYAEFKSALKTAGLLHKEEVLKHCFQHKTYYDVENTVFSQEPDVKEEMQRLYWALALVRVRQNLEKTNQFELLSELFSRNLLSPPAFKNMQNALNFLARVRLFLHLYQKGAHRDVMSYEVRETIAHRMGFDLQPFYKEYFYHAGYPLKRYSRNLFWESMASDAAKVRTLAEGFALNAENQIIFEGDPERFAQNGPQWIFRVLAWVAERNYHLSYRVIRSIENQVDQMAPIFLEQELQEEAKDYFKRIIRGKYFSKALRLMHEFGLLANYYIPEFKNICGLLQDIYVHKFPTDMHVLSALDALNKLEIGKEADSFLVSVYHSQADKTALKLAVLLHDIGKGQKKEDENEELVGARLIPRLLRNLGYDQKPKRIKDVAFLVEKHLSMRDLMLLDPEADDTYEMVWDMVDHDKERLKMLVLLTYADRGGTKMKLSPSEIEQLKMFYQFSLHRKKRQAVPIGVKMDFLKRVRLPNEVQSQLEVYYRFTQSPHRFASELFYKPDQPSELVVCAKDQKFLLFNICAVLAFNRLSIVEADIQTLKYNAFDVFKILDSSGKPIDYSNLFFIQDSVHRDLKKVFIQNEPVSKVFEGKELAGGWDQNPLMDLKLKVKIIGRAVNLVTHDLLGIFMMEAKVFSQWGLEIQKAVVHTSQGTASNIFYLRPKDVVKIIENEERFKATLNKNLNALMQSPSTLLEV